LLGAIGVSSPSSSPSVREAGSTPIARNHREPQNGDAQDAAATEPDLVARTLGGEIERGLHWDPPQERLAEAATATSVANCVSGVVQGRRNRPGSGNRKSRSAPATGDPGVPARSCSPLRYPVPAAASALSAALYQELHAIAERQLRRGGPSSPWAPRHCCTRPTSTSRGAKACGSTPVFLECRDSRLVFRSLGMKQVRFHCHRL
jgi:hypothetical protein